MLLKNVSSTSKRKCNIRQMCIRLLQKDELTAKSSPVYDGAVAEFDGAKVFSKQFYHH